MADHERWHTPLESMEGKTPFERLQELAAERKSGSQIAQILSAEDFEVTRSAVGAKADRNNIKLQGGDGSGRRRNSKPGKETLSLQERLRRQASKPLPPEVVIAESPVTFEDGTHVSTLAINDRMCRWPIGDPSENDFHFCGHKPKKGKPYCEAHARKAYQPQTNHRRSGNDEAPGRGRIVASFQAQTYK